MARRNVLSPPLMAVLIASMPLALRAQVKADNLSGPRSASVPPPRQAGTPTLTSTVALAEAAFESGRRALEADKSEAACSFFEESQRLDPSVGALIGLATCRERLDRLASAWATYAEAADLAAHLGQSIRHDFAKQHADELLPQLSQLTVQVDPDTLGIEGVVYYLDNMTLGPALFGNPMPIDGGTHRFQVDAPDHLSWQVTFDVPARQAHATVAVPRLQPVLKPQAPSERVMASRTSAPQTPVVRSPAGSDSHLPSVSKLQAEMDAKGTSGPTALQWTGIGVGALGVASAVFSGVQLSKALSDDSVADRSCIEGKCTTDTGVQKSGSAVEAGNLATYFGTGATVFLASAVALIWFGADDNETGVSIGPNHLLVSGQF